MIPARVENTSTKYIFLCKIVRALLIWVMYLSLTWPKNA